MIKLIATIVAAIAFSTCATFAQTQPQKEISAKRINAKITVDGDLKEADWASAPVATDFIERRPTPFKPEDKANATQIYFLYTNQGLYIGGYCHEKNVDSISKELIGRDGFGNNDFLGIIFDTYNDKLNGFGYFVTPRRAGSL